MKTHLKFLLGLVLIVLVFSGCEDPSRLEIPEGTKVEFKWCTCFNKNINNSSSFRLMFPRYLLSLRNEGENEGENNWVFDYPEGYNSDSYIELMEDEERFKKFSDDAFEEVFGTKYYKEGTQIPLTKWNSEALDLVENTHIYLCFLAEDVKEYKNINIKDSLNEIDVNNEDIVVYIYWKIY